ncbi:MAG: XRE family transcriptional regulator [Balneolaceae bacterium]
MNKHIGSNFDDFLEDQEMLAEAEAKAIKRVIAYQLQVFMEREQLSKTKMAKRMRTSRSALDRLLNPDNPSVTLQTLERAAIAIGKRIKMELI